jgi:hypothetical protein
MSDCSCLTIPKYAGNFLLDLACSWFGPHSVGSPRAEPGGTLPSLHSLWTASSDYHSLFLHVNVPGSASVTIVRKQYTSQRFRATELHVRSATCVYVRVSWSLQAKSSLDGFQVMPAHLKTPAHASQAVDALNRALNAEEGKR